MLETRGPRAFHLNLVGRTETSCPGPILSFLETILINN